MKRLVRNICRISAQYSPAWLVSGRQAGVYTEMSASSASLTSAMSLLCDCGLPTKEMSVDCLDKSELTCRNSGA